MNYNASLARQETFFTSQLTSSSIYAGRSFVQVLACSISAGNAGLPRLDRQACFQFVGVNLSTIALKASWTRLV